MDRVGVGNRVYSLGAPHQSEFGLRLTFKPQSTAHFHSAEGQSAGVNSRFVGKPHLTLGEGFP
jgi:hypothetical protein